MNHKIEPLKKVLLSLEAGVTECAMDLTPEPLPYEFIYGLGVEGLTPFEMELAQRSVGNEWVFSLKRGEIRETFQHLPFPALSIPDHLNQFYMKVRVDRVMDPGRRELIGAMAEITNCGDHCCGH